MSWEDQGRQFHSWFGHGTSDVAADGGAVAVGEAAVSALDGPRGAAVRGMLIEGGSGDLADALPIWVAAAGLSAEAFRSTVVGPGFSAEGAASLQRVGRAMGMLMRPGVPWRQRCRALRSVASGMR